MNDEILSDEVVNINLKTRHKASGSSSIGFKNISIGWVVQMSVRIIYVYVDGTGCRARQ